MDSGAFTGLEGIVQSSELVTQSLLAEYKKSNDAICENFLKHGWHFLFCFFLAILIVTRKNSSKTIDSSWITKKSSYICSVNNLVQAFASV